MTISVETLLVVSLMMAVFAAVSTVGSSLYLGAGFERLRAGFENIKKQTAFFSDALHKLDDRVDSVEKQSGYFFEAIHNLEQTQLTAPEQVTEEGNKEIASDTAYLCAGRAEADSSRSEILLGDFSFGCSSPEPVETETIEAEAPTSLHFH